MGLVHGHTGRLWLHVNNNPGLQISGTFENIWEASGEVPASKERADALTAWCNLRNARGPTSLPPSLPSSPKSIPPTEMPEVIHSLEDSQSLVQRRSGAGCTLTQYAGGGGQGFTFVKCSPGDPQPGFSSLWFESCFPSCPNLKRKDTSEA